MRSRSSVVAPDRRPWPCSARRTQWRSVSPEQPIFSAIEWIADHCEVCSAWWSKTIRTARARTSGEYGGTRFVMAPSSQELEPPENPVRFSSAGLVAEQGLVQGKRIGVDASTLEANAALRTIVRRDDGRTYREMLTQIAKESGIETPSGPRRWLQSWHLMRLLIGPEPRERKLPVHWPVHSSSTLSGPQIVVLVATSYNGF